MEFCSIAIINLNQGGKLVYYDEKFLDGQIKSYEFKISPLSQVLSKEAIDAEKEEIITLSGFSSDGETTTLISMSFEARAETVNVTNPYGEPLNATIKTTDEHCLFENGKKEITETFEASETKSIPLFSLGSVQCDITKVEYNFIKNTGDINIGKLEIVIFSLSVVGGISILGGITFLVFFYKKRKK